MAAPQAGRTRHGGARYLSSRSGNPDVARTYWLPLFAPCSEALVRRLVAEFGAGWRGRFGRTPVISDPAGEAFLGVIMLRREGADAAELSCGVAPRQRNRGLATRAVRLLARWAFAAPGPRRLEIRTTVGKAAARRVAERARFARGGSAHARAGHRPGV